MLYTCAWYRLNLVLAHFAVATESSHSYAQLRIYYFAIQIVLTLKHPQVKLTCEHGNTFTFTMTARALLKNGSIMHYEKSGMSVLHGMELRGTEVTGQFE